MSTSALPKHVATGQAVATNPALGEQRVHSPPAYAGSVESDEVVLLGFSDGETESAILSREHEAAGVRVAVAMMTGVTSCTWAPLVQGRRSDPVVMATATHGDFQYLGTTGARFAMP